MASDTQSAPDPVAARAPAGSAEQRSVPLRLRDGARVWLRAVDPPDARDECAAIVAEGPDGREVGCVAYRRVYGPRAVLTLAVDDDNWDRGLPEALVAGIAAEAAAAGISTLLIRVAASDVRLLGMLVDRFEARCRRDGSEVDVELRAGTTAQPA